MLKFRCLIPVMVIFLGCITVQIAHADDISNAGNNSVNIQKYQKEHRVIIVKPGMTLVSLLTKLGVDNESAVSAYNSMRKVYDTRNLKVGQHLEITATFDTETHQLKTLDKIVITPESGVKYILNRDETGTYIAKAVIEKLYPDIKVVNGIINGTVLDSMVDAGVAPSIAKEAINRISHRVNLRIDIQEGDTFKVKYNVSKVANTHTLKTGDLLYVSLTSGNNTYTIYRFKGNFYDELGQAPKAQIATNNNLYGEDLKEFKKEMQRIDNIKGNDSINTYQEETNNSEIKLIEDSITLNYRTNEYFYIYTGSDISKEKLDSVINEIRNEIGNDVGFSIYDDEIASEIAYMDWVSMSSYSSFSQSFHNNMEYCYNYKREHSLVEADSTNFVVFSNYELDKTYQKNKRSGIYKHCNPKEFVQQNIQNVRNVDNQRKREYAKLKQISSNNQLQQQCRDIIRTKFRYVNNLSFNNNINVDQRNDTYTFSGVLNVEATNGVKAVAEYKCIYNDSKKEFVDWFVGELQPMN